MPFLLLNFTPSKDQDQQHIQGVKESEASVVCVSVVSVILS